MNRPASRAALALAAMWLGAAVLATPSADEWPISVVRHDDEFVVDATIQAPVTPAVAWAVLTDFDSMARWVPNLQSSQVLSKPGEQPIRVAQKGAGSVGPFSVPFDVVREVELVGQQTIKAKNVAGNFRRMVSTTMLSATPAGGGTRIDFHLEVVPDRWIPPLIGVSVMRSSIRQQFVAIVAEMERRAAPTPPSPAPPR